MASLQELSNKAVPLGCHQHELNTSWVDFRAYQEEQRLRLDAQDKLATADETVAVLEELLAKVTARLKQVEGENLKLRLENSALAMRQVRPVSPQNPFTTPFTVGDFPTRPLQQTYGDSPLTYPIQCAVNMMGDPVPMPHELKSVIADAFKNGELHLS